MPPKKESWFQIVLYTLYYSCIITKVTCLLLINRQERFGVLCSMLIAQRSNLEVSVPVKRVTLKLHMI